jgi:hypothetical protein
LDPLPSNGVPLFFFDGVFDVAVIPNVLLKFFFYLAIDREGYTEGWLRFCIAKSVQLLCLVFLPLLHKMKRERNEGIGGPIRYNRAIPQLMIWICPQHPLSL